MILCGGTMQIVKAYMTVFADSVGRNTSVEEAKEDGGAGIAISRNENDNSKRNIRYRPV